MATGQVFPFPYFGHAYSEYVIVEVCVWFERAPSPKDRQFITRALTEGHAFFSEAPSDDVVWSGSVASYSEVLDHARKLVTVKDKRVSAALKSADLALYGTTKKAMKAVPFAMHLIVDSALLALHKQFPIAFAVRKQGPRDRLTPWHAWSLERRGAVMQRISEMLQTSPSNASQRQDCVWVAPWLRAATEVARACTEKRHLNSLDAGEKGALADFFLDVSAHAEPREEWGDSSAAFGDVTECRDTLLALVDKLGGVRTPLSNASDVLKQIQKEAQQFEFTRIKLSECPTFEVAKSELRFEVATAATEQLLRELEALSGNRPGATGLSFDPSEQQRLQILEKLISQLLRRKGTFNHEQALAMLKVLSSSIRPLGAWLPIELIAEKLSEYVDALGHTQKFDAALAALLALPWPLNKTSHHRELFEALE